MASILPHFFFYLFLAGTILFSILGILSLIGNPAIMVENTRKDDNEQIIQEDDLKGRIAGQYFVAAAIDLIFAILFLVISCRQKETNPSFVVEMDNNPTPLVVTQENQLKNMADAPEPQKTDTPGDINKDNSEVGMTEKDNLVSE